MNLKARAEFLDAWSDLAAVTAVLFYIISTAAANNMDYLEAKVLVIGNISKSFIHSNNVCYEISAIYHDNNADINELTPSWNYYIFVVIIYIHLNNKFFNWTANLLTSKSLQIHLFNGNCLYIEICYL